MSWSKTINYILRSRKYFRNIDISDMLKIFDSSVKPILCYVSQVWGYQYVDRVEKVHTQFCKKMLSVFEYLHFFLR